MRTKYNPHDELFSKFKNKDGDKKIYKTLKVKADKFLQLRLHIQMVFWMICSVLSILVSGLALFAPDPELIIFLIALDMVFIHSIIINSAKIHEFKIRYEMILYKKIYLEETPNYVLDFIYRTRRFRRYNYIIVFVSFTLIIAGLIFNR